MRTQLVNDLLADLLQDIRLFRVDNYVHVHVAYMCTRKNLTAYQQDVFALLVPSC